MKRIVGIVYVFLCWGISLHAQSVRVIETLKKLEKSVDFFVGICYYNTRLERQGKTY